MIKNRPISIRFDYEHVGNSSPKYLRMRSIRWRMQHHLCSYSCWVIYAARESNLRIFSVYVFCFRFFSVVVFVSVSFTQHILCKRAQWTTPDAYMITCVLEGPFLHTNKLPILWSIYWNFAKTTLFVYIWNDAHFATFNPSAPFNIDIDIYFGQSIFNLRLLHWIYAVDFKCWNANAVLFIDIPRTIKWIHNINTLCSQFSVHAVISALNRFYCVSFSNLKANW